MNGYVARHQVYIKKQKPFLKGIKIKGLGLVQNNIRKESDFLNMRLSNIIAALKEAFKKKKYKFVIPRINITDKPFKRQNVCYHKETEIIFISKHYLKTAADHTLLISVLYAISNYFFHKSKMKLVDLRVIHDFLIKNKNRFKDNFKGIYFCIPTNKYGKGICLPKINVNSFEDFVIKIFSFYIQDIFPDKVNDGDLATLLSWIQSVL